MPREHNPFGDVEPVRRPGDFARHPETGAPYVAHPTDTCKSWGLNKAQLIELCAERGITVPANAKKSEIEALLGPKPKRVQYGRPSSLGKQIENTTNLQKWSERAEVLGWWLEFKRCGGDPTRSEILGELAECNPSSLDDAEAKDLLDRVAVKLKNRAQAGLAAERGTYVHERTEDYDTERDWIEAAQRGEDLGLPTEVTAALVAAWEKATNELFEVLAVEATCVDDRWHQAGTLDRIARLTSECRFVTATGEYVTLPAGWTGILDIKTGKLRRGADGFVDHWHGYAVQLASYAQSVPYDTDTDTRGEWSVEIDQKFAVIAHLDVLAALDGEAKCRLVLVDLEAGRFAGELCVAARNWERRRDVFSVDLDAHCVSVPVAGCDDTATTVTRPAPAESAASAIQPPGGYDQPVSAGPVAADASTPQPAAEEAPPTLGPSAALSSPAGDAPPGEPTGEPPTATAEAAGHGPGGADTPGPDTRSEPCALDDIEHPPTIMESAQRRMVADAKHEQSKCRSCGAAIRWAKTEAGKAIPLDLEPTSSGNMFLQAGVAYVHKPGDGTDEQLQYVSHFATCPHASEHRKQPPADREGRDLGGADYKALLAAVKELSTGLREWLKGVADEAAAAGCDFRPGRGGQHLTVRRYELHRGLTALGVWLGEPSNDVLEAFVHSVATPAGSGITPSTGEIVGSLDAVGATAFAQLCDDVVSRRAVAIVGDDGVLRCVAA